MLYPARLDFVNLEDDPSSPSSMDHSAILKQYGSRRDSSNLNNSEAPQNSQNLTARGIKELFDLSAEDLTESQVEQFYTYGYAQYKFGHVRESIDVFRLLCMRRPFESRFWFALGAANQELQEYEAALKAWAMAAITKQTDPYPHFHAAECALSLHQLGDAKLALKEAEQLIAKEKAHPLHTRIPALKITWNL